MTSELVLTGYGFFLKKKGDRLITEKKGERREYPVRQLELILITGKGAISVDAIRLAVKYGLSVYLAYSTGTPYAAITPVIFTGSAETRRQQILAYYDERGLHLAKEFVRGKLVNQANLLKSLSLSRGRTNVELAEELHEYSQRVMDQVKKLDSIRGTLDKGADDRIRSVEANGAKVYWEALSKVIPEGLEFPGRVTFGAVDVVNRLLNFGYGYLRARVTSAILYAGLDPYAGYLHAYRSGEQALAFDMMEEFRPLVVDRVVITLIARKMVSKSWLEKDGLKKSALAKLMSSLRERVEHRVKFQGKKYRLKSLIKKQPRNLVSHLKGTSRYRAVTGW